MSYPTPTMDDILIDTIDLTLPVTSVYTVSSASSASYQYDWNTAGIVGIDSNLKGNALQVNGDANFEGDVIIKGKSINDSIERIEERLAILRPNEELEERWENLRGLRKAYMDLEAEIIEKEKIWKILKK